MATTANNPDGSERTRLDMLPRVAQLVAWPTPNTMEGGQTSRGGKRKGEALMGGIAPWPTPQEDNANNSTGDKWTAFSDLPTTAQLASWATPSAHGDTSGGNCLGDALKKAAGMKRPSGASYGTKLREQVLMAPWATPRVATNGGYGSPERCADGRARLEDQVHGLTSASSSAETARPAGYQLNPRFSLWLMGFPTEWASCGATAMQSCRKSRKRS
jgi:hypothetical protein